VLVLTRRENQSVVLFDAAGRELARVTITSIRKSRGNGPTVQIGLTADPTIKILRDEVVGPATGPESAKLQEPKQP
jgi:sRNA-binding carbon storage regulator CsrA